MSICSTKLPFSGISHKWNTQWNWIDETKALLSAITALKAYCPHFSMQINQSPQWHYTPCIIYAAWETSRLKWRELILVYQLKSGAPEAKPSCTSRPNFSQRNEKLEEKIGPGEPTSSPAPEPLRRKYCSAHSRDFMSRSASWFVISCFTLKIEFSLFTSCLCPPPPLWPVSSSHLFPVSCCYCFVFSVLIFYCLKPYSHGITLALL